MVRSLHNVFYLLPIDYNKLIKKRSVHFRVYFSHLYISYTSKYNHLVNNISILTSVLYV